MSVQWEWQESETLSAADLDKYAKNCEWWDDHYSDLIEQARKRIEEENRQIAVWRVKKLDVLQKLHDYRNAIAANGGGK